MGLDFEAVAEKYPLEEYIQLAAFEQILEMDDDDNREFSTSIVQEFYDQTDIALQQLDEALTNKELSTLSSLGHFLKGSSATLGLYKLYKCCAQIQDLGSLKDPVDQQPVSTDDALTQISSILKTLKSEYVETRKILSALGY